MCRVQGGIPEARLLEIKLDSAVFVYHPPRYDDTTWIPNTLEYGVLRDDRDWGIESFHNKNPG